MSASAHWIEVSSKNLKVYETCRAYLNDLSEKVISKTAEQNPYGRAQMACTLRRHGNLARKSGIYRNALVQTIGELADGPDVVGSRTRTRSCRVFAPSMLRDRVVAEATPDLPDCSKRPIEPVRIVGAQLLLDTVDISKHPKLDSTCRLSWRKHRRPAAHEFRLPR